ncbi:PiggyBac transposable element-derived protein 4 [Eumeta japonica]|uniref:PiggyBac transposable element-derived protein 4 n=1 Tax=Eumeta variegata TaxID=151549 RepID=A0A4C1UZ40_EUMVA|nr:PiggyBac transposable element-derived protein 4 [Eumeta japonica]
MSEQRFKFLTRALRFDNIEDRHDRAVIDKHAPIREIFDLILINFQKHFVPSAEMTLDEQLLAFRGRCAFRQYIPNKPAKYGIKVFALVDVHYPYTFNLEIYAGQQPEGLFRLSNEKHDVVMRMARPVLGKHLNITMDNWFSSQRVAKQLFQNGTTMVGTMRRDKRKVPCEFRVARGNPLFSSKFGFNQPCTLVSYVTKPNKVVILMSTMQNDTAIDSDTGDRQKPEIITYYNRTKDGVHLVDKMCSLYDVSRNSRRWPVTIFYDLLNLSALNALCIYTTNKNYESVRRRDFLDDLSLAWTKPLANRRLETKTLPRSLTFKIKDFFGIIHTQNESTASTSPPSKSVRRCHDCGRARSSFPSRRTSKKLKGSSFLICSHIAKTNTKPLRTKQPGKKSSRKMNRTPQKLFVPKALRSKWLPVLFGINGHVVSLRVGAVGPAPAGPGGKRHLDYMTSTTLDVFLFDIPETNRSPRTPEFGRRRASFISANNALTSQVRPSGSVAIDCKCEFQNICLVFL